MNTTILTTRLELWLNAEKNIFDDLSSLLDAVACQSMSVHVFIS